MSLSQEKLNQKVEQTITAAVKKLNCGKENDICRYLPSSTGGYIHHFTMRKMKTEEPETLIATIEKHIINTSKPVSVPPKQRAARGSRKRRDQFLFTKNDIALMLELARQHGHKDMVSKLTPKKDLKTIKRELIVSIRHGKTDQDLWASYCDAIQSPSTVAITV